MRIEQRPFPFTCHTTSKMVRPFISFICGIVLLLMILLPGMDADIEMFPTDRPEAEWYRRDFVYLLAAIPLAFLAMTPRNTGYRAMLPNRAVVARGATWVTPRMVPVDLLLLGLAGILLGASGIVVFRIFGSLGEMAEASLHWTIAAPGSIAIGIGVVLHVVWQQLRGIKLTPESITYWRGIGRVTVDWDEFGDAISTNDVRDHEGYRKHLDRYVPGAKIVVPVERVMDAKLRVHWEDADTPRLLLETDHFTVEPSALLTAILALRDNPELRPLLGTRESKVLFAGPPWRVRRHLYRTQQWWPAGAAPEGIAVDRDGVVKEFQ